MTANKYSMGHQQASINDLSWVDAKWGKGDNCANKLRMLNGAFETFFLIMKSIGDCEDDGHRGVMTAELKDAGDSGWGMGVTDLDDAFTHWLGPGHWTDNNVGSYMKAHGMFGAEHPAIAGASTSCCWGLATNIMPGPLAAVNFFKALDDKMDDLKDAIQDHDQQVPLLVKGMANKDSSAVDKAFRAIADAAKVAKKFLWLAPKPDPSTLISGGTSVDSTVALAIQGGVTFVKTITDMDTFLTVHQQALRTGIFNNQQATAFAALTVALGKVPVLGFFYKQIGKNIPGLLAGINAEFEEHYRMIDKAVQDATNH
jgi:hypothetical protein